MFGWSLNRPLLSISEEFLYNVFAFSKTLFKDDKRFQKKYLDIYSGELSLNLEHVLTIGYRGNDLTETLNPVEHFKT